MTVEERAAQRENALEAANAIRHYRAETKMLVAGARLRPDEVLICGDPKLALMPVEQLLKVVPGMGRERLRRVLGRGLIAGVTPISQLTPRQRGYLLVVLRRHRETSVIWRRKLEEWGGDQLVG